MNLSLDEVVNIGAHCSTVTTTMRTDAVKKKSLIRENIRLAKKVVSNLSPALRKQLRVLTADFSFSLRYGDLLLLNTGWYVTQTGLIRLATRRCCRGIEVHQIPEFSDALNRRYAFKAIVYKSRQSPGFVGYGDADPSNVSSLVRGAEMRVAETRAVNRALRKAYGIGICSIEEIGSNAEPPQGSNKLPPQAANGNGRPRTVRDRLCQIIRQYELDPDLVKAYATESCGVKTLRDATREQVESFVGQLADWAEKDLNALRCQLNSYLGQKESVA
jgi:hypothetical protein